MNRAPRGAARQPELAPPHDLDAEEAALACMLGSAVARAEARERVSADDFCRPRNGHIFEAICQLEDGGEPVDSVTAYDQLRRLRLADVVTSGDLVALAANGLPTFAFAAKYGAIVAELAAKGRLAAVGAELPRRHWTRPETEPRCARSARPLCSAPNARTAGGAVVSAADTIGLVADGRQQPIGAAWAWPACLRVTGTWTRCWVVASRAPWSWWEPAPAWARQPSLSACRFRFAPERPDAVRVAGDGAAEIGSRLVAMVADVPVEAQRSGRLSDAQWSGASNGCRRHSPPPCSRLWTRPARREARSGSPGREGPSRVGARVNRLPPAPGPAREKRTAQARDRRDGLAPEDDGP